MKKRLTAVAAFLFIMLQAAPALAAVNLNISGQTYLSIDKPQIISGSTMVTLDMIQKTIGADISVSGRDITITGNKDVLKMTLDNKNATINGKALVLSTPPKILSIKIMVPARGVFEALGARVSWQADSQTLSVVYDEHSNGMNAGEILDKMETALEQCKSYKMRESIDKMRINNDDNLSKQYPELPLTYNTHNDMDMASQAKPLLFFCKTIEHRTDIDDRSGIESEAVGNENGLFLKTGKCPWERIVDSNVSMAGLIWAANGEEPIACLKQLRKSGAILSLGNDIQENSNNYWVIHVTMSQEALPDIAFGALSDNPLWYLHDELTGAFERVLKNTQAEMSYTVMIDQETCLPSSIRFDSTRIFTNYEIPGEAEGVSAPAISVLTDTNSGSCQFYGFGESFTIPDVSSATPGCMPEG